MASNTGTPKMTPVMPKQHLKTLTDSELWGVIKDKDYSVLYRRYASEEHVERGNNRQED